MPPSLVGQMLGKYQLTDRLGRGGMSEVYKAYQPGLDRYVAIKVLHPHLAEQPDFVARFKREAQSVSALQHPNIVQVFDFDVQQDLYYMAMAYIEGRTLKETLRDMAARGERLPILTVLQLAAQVSDALGYAHRCGMIHRDVKPANILVPSLDHPVLSDFGIAHLVDVTTLTRDGSMVGTPAYMAPEQATGGKITERADIYALGVTLYEMLTGQPPFDADTPYGVILKHISDPLIPPHLIVPLPLAVEPAVLKALAKNPADRFSSADDMAAALRRAAEALQSDNPEPPFVSALGTQVSLGDHISSTPDGSVDLTRPLDARPDLFAYPEVAETAPSAATPLPPDRAAQGGHLSNAGIPIAARIAALVGVALLLAALAWQLGFGRGRGSLPPAPPGTIYAAEIMGNVEIVVAGQPPRALQSGDTVSVGAGDPSTILRTQENSRAIISLEDGSGLYLGPMTIISLDRLFDPSDVNAATLITIRAGKLLARFAGSDARLFTIKSPPGARMESVGTTIGAQYLPLAEQFDVDCLEGSCRLFGGPGVPSVSLASCQRSWIVADGAPANPEAASSDDWRDLFGDAAPLCATASETAPAAAKATLTITSTPSATPTSILPPTSTVEPIYATAAPTNEPTDEPPTAISDLGEVITDIPIIENPIPTEIPIVPTLPLP